MIAGVCGGGCVGASVGRNGRDRQRAYRRKDCSTSVRR